MTDADRMPVVIAIGEYTDRPAEPEAALEPVMLMVQAMRRAAQDAGIPLLGHVTSVDLVGLVSWRYRDPVGLLCARLGIDPVRRVNASMGGETPVRLMHEAALRIAAGEGGIYAITGGEAGRARNQARKAGIRLPWTDMASREDAVRFPSSRYALSGLAQKLGVRDPAQIYPFYEMAAQHAWGETPAEGHARSAELWARYAAVAAGNDFAWMRRAPSAEEIGTPGPDNRLINFPYPKLMVANPQVNQAGAVVIASLATARALGVNEAKLVHIWGGAAAAEPEDFLQRDRYDHSTAQAAALRGAVALAGGDAHVFARLELYSCFPVVPKMAWRTLGLDGAPVAPSVAGGLTFFGGPLNNYMTHAACAMVRALRAGPEEIGLLYGQGGYVNKHHALVLSVRVPISPLRADFSVQDEADAARAPVPAVVEEYSGPAVIETYTVGYGRDGGALEGIVILRTPDGQRTMARVPEGDTATMAILQSMERSAIGTAGHVRTDVFGKPVFRAGNPERAVEPARRFCAVERDGPLTIVTIRRPEVMNALHPEANAELAEVFDAFAADPDQWVAILTGAGEQAFSAGNDLKATARAMARGASTEVPLTGFAGLTARYDLDKPVIAAVNGLAMGGGFEIALACDLIIAAEHAVFALPEPRVGLAALAGGLLRLPRQIGEKHALGMILTGRRVTAAEGHALGFVNEVAPSAEVLAVARRWAADIIACSPMSIRASKAAVRAGLSSSSIADAQAGQAALPAVRALFRSADVREGPLAFAEKRKPRWSGRGAR